jgi:hypothetical protein
MPSKAATVAQYLAELPPDRREAISAVRRVVLENLDRDYQETMQYGMIGYSVPHSIFPAGYHCDPRQPLPFASLGSQKNHMALYLMCVYGDCDGDGPAARHHRWFRDAWSKTGKKLDMGKACIRFKKAEDLALDVIGEAIRRIPAKKWIQIYQQSLDGRTAKKPAGKKTAGNKPPKAAPAKAKGRTKPKSAR